MTSPQDTGGLREKVARRLFEYYRHHATDCEYDGLDELAQDHWLRDADAILTLINDTPAPSQAGWRLVPIEPTEEMLAATIREHGLRDTQIEGRMAAARATYRAMLAAAPLPEPPDTRTEAEA